MENITEEHALSSFERMCRKYPGKPAVIYLGESFSYLKMKELSERFATSLNDLGVKNSDRVMIYIPNSVQWVIAYLGILQIGAVAVPISPIYTPNEIAYMINDSGAETIICQDTNFSYVKEVLPKTTLRRVIFTNLADLLPWWKRGMGMLFDRVPKGSVEGGKNVYPFKSLLKKHPHQPPRPYINPKEQLAYILYTGGTTGLPKGVSGSHVSVRHLITDFHEIVEGFVKEGESTLLLVNPLFHIMAKGTFMSLGLALGNTTVLMPMPQTDAALEAIQRYKVDLFLGVPTLYRMILENDRVDFYDLSSLRYCWCGGDVLPVEVFNRWKEKFGVPIYQNFGSTETGYVASSPLDREPSATCLGSPLSSKEIKIVNSDTLEPVSPHTPGELLVSSDYLMNYWNKPEETAESFVELDGKTYYRMKDIVQMNEDGLHYVDRGADVIKYKGYRVSASEIEAVLQDHPAVIGSCAIGVPDPKVGERIKAIVVLKEDVRGVGSSELISWCRGKLAPYKVPQYIEFRDMLPKSKVGKLLRRDIREEERRRG